MINIIVAVDNKNGIGYKNKLPWHIPEELSIFKEKTDNSIIIVGSKTFKDLPYLKNRIIFCISRNFKNVKNDVNNLSIYQSIEEAVDTALILSKSLDKKIFVIGGNQIYNYFFKNYEKLITVHISFINDIYHCDTYFDINNIKNFYIKDEFKSKDGLLTHYEMKYRKYGEKQYLYLVKDIIENGERRKTRNAETISDFCRHLKFDLRDGFPLLTTKKMFIKGVIEELLFFIRGDTNSKILEEKGINIWKGNTSRAFLDSNGFLKRPEGEMGPMYGSIWRHFNSLTDEDTSDSKCILFKYKNCHKDGTSYSEGLIQSVDFDIDQLKFVINEIITNPTSRRILMTSFNPSQVLQGVLWPCHSITLQFYVEDCNLDMFCYNRSSDVGLGLPFNIASSSLLLIIIAKLTNLTPRYFNLSLGDTHIYLNHVDPLVKQILRIPYTFPQIELPEFKTLEEVEKLTYKDFKILDYKSYDIVKMEMVA